MRTARGDSVEAKPEYIRHVFADLGLGNSGPVATPSVKRTPTTESPIELDKRVLHKTAVGKLLHKCQERTDIMYSVKGKARKILCPTDSDEMSMHRITRYLKGVSSAKYWIQTIKSPQSVNVYTDSD